MYEIFIYWWYNDIRHIKILFVHFVRKLDEDWKISRLLPSRVCVLKLGNYPILMNDVTNDVSAHVTENFLFYGGWCGHTSSIIQLILHVNRYLWCSIDGQFLHHLSHYLLCCHLQMMTLKMMLTLIFLFYVYSSIIISLSIFVLGAYIS